MLAFSLKNAVVKTVKEAPASSETLPLSVVLLRAYCHPAVPPVVVMWSWQLDVASPGYLAANSLYRTVSSSRLPDHLRLESWVHPGPE